MAINPALLIAAPMLQDSFVDKDGTPMSAGVVTCFADNSRTTLKNWFYQTGTPGNYTYVPLPNPLTLSAAGTICDINGVDTIPFFYPFAENLSQTGQYIVERYFITIVNHAQTNQITRANFPYNIDESINGNTNPELDNLIINNGFWRNSGTVVLNTVTQKVVAPSQHDGFQYPDIQFIKNNTSGSDTLTFTKFPLANTQALAGDVTPEFYINHTCSNTPTGETQKCYQFPISLHVNVLANFEFTATIQAQNAGGTGTGENVIKLFLLQDTGTGTTPPAPVLIGQITVSPTWTKYSFTSVFTATSGLTLGGGGDDAWYLQVQMPLNVASSINFTRPSIFLAQTSPTNSFLTYDQVDSVISSPRTGDIRVSANSFQPFGWVVMNDGTIGNASSVATTRANIDTWQLFNLIWTLAKPYTALTVNPISQMYTSAGAPVTYGASAIADYNANRALSLTKLMGQVILGTVPLANLLPATPTHTGFSSVVTDSNSAGNLLFTTSTANLLNLFKGNTVTFQNTGGALNGNIVANAIYYMVPVNSTTFFVATTFANAISNTVIAFGSAGSGVTTAYTQNTGSREGEYDHHQVEGELAQHHHPGLIAGLDLISVQSGAGTTVVTALPGPLAGVTLPTDPLTPTAAANVTQPGVFYNMFIKL
jgi:hypothetical protein